MKARIQVVEFKDSLNKILSVVEKKNTRPILNFIQIKIFDKYLELKATDLEVSAKILVNCTVEEPGIFCANAKHVFDIVKELPNCELSLEINGDNTLRLSCGSINFSLLIYPHDEFPLLQFLSNTYTFKLPAKELVEVINKTAHAISTDETRIFLNGLFLQEVNNKLRTVATDGYRLVLIESNVDNLENKNIKNGVILPRKGVTEIKKLAESRLDQVINISIDDSFVYVNIDDKYMLSIRLIAKEYLKYQAVIPKSCVFNFIVDRISLLNAVKRIRIMANERSNAIKFCIKHNELELTANHPTLGNATESLAIQFEETEKELEVAFNAKFIIDLLSIYESDELMFGLNNEISPVQVTSELHKNLLSIIMPIKL